MRPPTRGRPSSSGASSGPVGLILTRQGIPVLEGTSSEGRHGGYRWAVAILRRRRRRSSPPAPELQLAVEAKKLLADKDIVAYVVSMPCVEWFESQPQEYRDSVLPPDVSARVAVEAGGGSELVQVRGDTGEIIYRALRRIGRRQDVVPRVRLHTEAVGRRGGNARSKIKSTQN